MYTNYILYSSLIQYGLRYYIYLNIYFTHNIYNKYKLYIFTHIVQQISKNYIIVNREKSI